MKRLGAVAVLVFVIAIGALAQQAVEQQSEQPHTGSRRTPAKTIAVTVLSKDPRVKGLTPDLNREAAAVVERAAPQANVIIVVGTKAEAAEQARQHNADYLLTIEFSPQSTASIDFGPGAGQPRDPEVYGHDRANMQGQMFLAWTVDTINASKKVRMHESRYVQPMEYPLPGTTVNTGGDTIGWDWVQSIASRSVRDAAAAATNKLKKKAGM